MSEIREGMLLRDNDPRMPGRLREVIGFDGKGRAIVRHPDGHGETRIALDRIHTDSKPRRSGWSVAT